jgi:hypothetical protein
MSTPYDINKTYVYSVIIMACSTKLPLIFLIDVARVSGTQEMLVLNTARQAQPIKTA